MRYLLRYPDRVLAYLGEHVQLTLLALGIALLIALPVGVLLARRRGLQGPVLGALSLLYTVPSLALFVLLVPLLGLGRDTALVALVAYAQVILVRNIVAGLEGVPRATLEAATGMGMTAWQRFWKVELPLALPVMLAGLRVATLSTIAIATVAALVDAGGLGRLLFEGISQNNHDKIVAGSLVLALLSLTINALIQLAERRATRAAHVTRG